MPHSVANLARATASPASKGPRMGRLFALVVQLRWSSTPLSVSKSVTAKKSSLTEETLLALSARADIIRTAETKSASHANLKIARIANIKSLLTQYSAHLAKKNAWHANKTIGSTQPWRCAEPNAIRLLFSISTPNLASLAILDIIRIQLMTLAGHAPTTASPVSSLRILQKLCARLVDLGSELMR